VYILGSGNWERRRKRKGKREGRESLVRQKMV
jgi:hypothetical protein